MKIEMLKTIQMQIQVILILVLKNKYKDRFSLPFSLFR